jgi:hypothetical protein
VIAEHPPDLCPHSNILARKQVERIPEFNVMAKDLGIEMIFAGIPVPEHKTYMIMKAPSFEAVRTLMVQTGLVMTNTITIRQTESLEEFAQEIKTTTPIF